jgi:hypothetical protein
MNFLMCSFAKHDSLHPGLSLSNTSLCSSKVLGHNGYMLQHVEMSAAK